MGLLTALADDGFTTITSLSKDVFISARMIGNGKLEFVLRQNPPPYKKHDNYKYIVSIKPHNKHLLQILDWSKG